MHVLVRVHFHQGDTDTYPYNRTIFLSSSVSLFISLFGLKFFRLVSSLFSKCFFCPVFSLSVVVEADCSRVLFLLLLPIMSASFVFMSSWFCLLSVFSPLL